MDEVFSSVEGRFKVSLKDSTMMWIVHYAMNKAQEKMNTKEGVIERLNEISKFYELAVMQLEGCLSFVESETESSTLESNHEEVLDDLREIRDRLQGRLEESEFAISEKDRELKERLENELKLRQALELKERKLISLGANLELEKARGDNVEDNEGKRNENSEVDFCESKTCVDQKMFNIKQRLEPEYNMLGEETHRGIDSKKVEEMGSDIDILNRTMDLAFGKMKSALFFCEMGPKEQQWKLKIEKDTMSILIKSFMREFQENIEAELRKQEEVLKGWWEHWPQLMNEVTSLQHELVPFMQGICAEDANTSAPSSPTDFGQKAFQESEGKSSPEETSHDRPKRSSPKGEEVNQMKEDNEEESNFVAKMIKNHESIIRQKSKQVNSCKHGILQEKRSSPTKRGKEQDSLKGRIQDVAARLDSLLNWNAKLSESLFDPRVVHKKDTLPEDKLSEFLVIDKVKEGNDTLASAWKKIEGVSYVSNEVQDKIREFKQEKEDRKTKSMVLKGMDLTLHKSIEEEFESNSDIERLIQEDVCKYYLKELVNQWNENIERQIRDEVFFIVFSEAAKENCLTHNFDLAEYQGGGTEKYGLECSTSGDKVGDIEGTIREDICMLIFSEMVKEYNRMLEGYNRESLIKEDKCQIFSTETVENAASIASMDCREDSIEEILLREDVYMAVFRGMFKDWKMELGSYYIENLIREEINQCIMVEALKDVSNLSREVKSPIQDNIMEVTHSTIMLNQVQNVKGEENFLKILESLVKCFEAEESLMQSAKSEIKEHSKQLDLGSERGELHEHEIFEDLITDEEQTLCSVTSKVEKALQQLGISRALLRELVNSLGLIASESEKMHHQTTINEVKIKPSSSVFLPLLDFSQIFAEFEGMVNKRLEIVSVRLEKMKYCLDSVIELVICLRSKELLYQKAFTRRCQNLRKAEAEVDLLGDQVDTLASLLEKVYAILHQYAPALQHYFEVSDILELMKKELIGGAARGASVVT